jgi:hypothetical protein
MFHINSETRLNIIDATKQAALKALGFSILLAALFGIESIPGFMALAEPGSAPAVKQSHDSDRPERKRPSIVNNTDDGPTIHFSKCRENDKGHVSCQFTDAAGAEHWVYLAGYKLPPLK